MESILCSKVTCSANSLSFHRNNHLLGLDERWRKKSIQQIVSNSGKSRLIFLSVNNKSVKSNTTTACSSPDDWTHAHEFDGEKIANKIKSEMESDIKRLMKKSNDEKYRPRLAILSVGQKDGDDSSQTLVRLIKKACQKVGIAWYPEELPAESAEEKVRHVVSKLNRDPGVHGVMVKLPLPQHLDEEKIMNFIDPEKDVHVAFAITPVQVEPVIIAMMLSNILDSAKRSYERETGVKFDVDKNK